VHHQGCTEEDASPLQNQQLCSLKQDSRWHDALKLNEGAGPDAWNFKDNRA